MGMKSKRWMRQAEFARLIGCQPSWVTALKKSGRLVLSRNGNRVDAPASLERIEQTRTLSAVTQPATSARKEQARKKQTREDTPGTGSGRVEDEIDTSDYSAARSRREHWNAEIARLEYARTVGSLIPLDDALRAASTLGVAVRARLDRLPDAVTPLLVESGSDEVHIHRVLTEAVFDILSDVSASLRTHIQQSDMRPQ